MSHLSGKLVVCYSSMSTPEIADITPFWHSTIHEDVKLQNTGLSSHTVCKASHTRYAMDLSTMLSSAHPEAYYVSISKYLLSRI